MTPVLLHVGYIKTATTFLQERVFDGSTPGLRLAAGAQTRAMLVQEILLADDYAFDAGAARARLEAMAGPLRAAGTLPVWSEEMLLGNPPHRRYDGFANARKLQMVYPRAKVLITIRRQPAMALSIYREYVLGGGALPLSAVIGRGDEPLGFGPVLRPDFLRFDRAIGHYQSLFGPENVLVLPREMLACDPKGYLAALAAFAGCGIPQDLPREASHKGEGFAAMALRRRVNRFLTVDPTRPRRRGMMRRIDGGLRRLDRVLPSRLDTPSRTRHEAAIAARYAGLFVESNRRTAALTGLDLARLGYDT